MFFKSFMPEPTFGSSGSKSGGGGRSRADRKGAQARFSAPKPVYRPATTSTRSSTADRKGAQAVMSAPKPKVSTADRKGEQAVLSAPKAPYVASKDNAPVTSNIAISKKPVKAPVNIAADTTSTAAGSAAGSSGGSSGKIKASKAQEDNLTVKRKARGTSKYQVTKASKNPLVVSKSNKKKVV
jgi:hypothetical protein